MKNLFPLALLCFTISLQAQKLQVPGTVIAHSPVSSGLYIGSPSICILSDGSYLASHDLFGPNSNEFVKPVSKIYRSANKGRTWQQVAVIEGQFWSKLFTYRGGVYFFGTDKHHGNTIIRTSTDNGNTWSALVDADHGLLLQGEYHCAPVTFIEYKGKLWRAMEDAMGEIKKWGKRYGAFMMSMDAEKDPMLASSWKATNVLRYDSTMLGGKFGAWIEGNAVVAPD